MQIILQPVLFEPDKDILSSLEKALIKEFNFSSMVTALPIKQIPEQHLFDNQSDAIAQLSDQVMALTARMQEFERKQSL